MTYGGVHHVVFSNERSKHWLNAKWNRVLRGVHFLTSIASTLSWH
jgi:hypothetical protein